MAPKSAMDTRESLDAVLSLVETPNGGTVHVWDDHASVGLYVYDWDLSSGVYRRLRVPAGSANRTPLASLKMVGSVPRVDCDFALQDDIRPEILRQHCHTFFIQDNP